MLRRKSAAGNTSARARARRENLTIRQLYTTLTPVFGGRFLRGTPKDIVDDMQEWVEGDARMASTSAHPFCRWASTGLWDSSRQNSVRGACSDLSTRGRRYGIILGWCHRGTVTRLTSSPELVPFLGRLRRRFGLCPKLHHRPGLGGGWPAAVRGQSQTWHSFVQLLPDRRRSTAAPLPS